MGVVKIPKPVRFFASIIFANDGPLESAEKKLEALIGRLRDKTEALSFYHTDYYEKEMGTGLKRVFLLFEPLLERDALPEIKRKTNDMEASLSQGGGRTVNIDPGYISLENVILATTKGYTHRIYLRNGIYADLTLMYHNGTFKPLEWTYPDYGSMETISMFNTWRDSLKEKMRSNP